MNSGYTIKEGYIVFGDTAEYAGLYESEIAACDAVDRAGYINASKEGPVHVVFNEDEMIDYFYEKGEAEALVAQLRKPIKSFSDFLQARSRIKEGAETV